MRLRIEITAKHKADALEVYSLARDSDGGIKPPVQRDGAWCLSVNAEASALGSILRAIDPHLSRAFSAGESSAETRRLRWEVR